MNAKEGKEMNVLQVLRRVSSDRAAAWHKGQVVPVTFRSTELAGEVGEVCNAVKKLARTEMGIVGGANDTTNLRDELADVVICVDLLAAMYDIDLWEAVCAKFNATSEKYGFPQRLPTESLEAVTDRGWTLGDVVRAAAAATFKPRAGSGQGEGEEI